VVFTSPIAQNGTAYFGLELAPAIFGSGGNLPAPPGSQTLGGTGIPTNPCGCGGEPVNTATGNYFESVTDLNVPGKGLAFMFTRAYNVQDSYSGPLGVNWTHSYNVILSVNAMTGVVAIKQGDGHQDLYAPTSGGAYTPQSTGLFNTLVKNGNGSFTETLTNQTRFNFSSAGTLLSIADRNGNTQTLTYGGSGTLASVTEPSGRVFSFAYDASGRILSLTDPLNRTLHYAYDSSGNLASFQDALGNTTTYAYDSLHELTSATDPLGNMFVQNTYDSQGRVTQQEDANLNTTYFDYNYPGNGLTTVFDPLGNSTVHVYDSTLRLIGIVDPLNNPTTYIYNSKNLRISEMDAAGNTTTYSYDTNGNLTGVTDALGGTTTRVYDSKNNLLTITDKLGRQVTSAYDANGNILSTQDAAGGITTWTYDSSGLILTNTNARKFTTSFQYDAYGNPTQVTDPLGGSTQTTYDPVGRVLTTKDPNGQIWTNSYDADDWLLSATDPLGHKTSYSYDADGNLTQLTDANGDITRYAYDVNNNLAQLIDADGNVSSFAYDGSNATSYDVYFGTASNPPFVLNTAGTSYMPGTLNSTTMYFWKIVAKNANGSTSSAIQPFTTLTPLPGVSGLSPGSGSGLSQTLTFTFSDSGGWQNLGVQDILINSALDGRHACYIAYVPSGATTGSLYLVDDAGDAGGPYTGMVLPSSQTASNSQCTINGTGSSASGSGNTLTLTLAITFNSSFAGNKIFYLASADTGTGNSGWQTPGTWTVPGPPPTGPGQPGSK
jgi:YD repeat-containing protein